jgi:uncharacterized protein
MLGLFRRLMPKEDSFFDLFERHSRTLVAGAEAMQGLLKGGDKVQNCCAEIFRQEHLADDITREVLQTVRRSFITPFDRGDIKDLIQSMDDAIDQMNKTAKAIVLYEVRDFDPLMREMGTTILDAATLTAEAVPLLSAIGKHSGRIANLTEQITRVEGRSDDLHDQGLKKLFIECGRADPMGYFIGSEIYQNLEKIVDRFEDVANEISGIMIENV